MRWQVLWASLHDWAEMRTFASFALSGTPEETWTEELLNRCALAAPLQTPHVELLSHFPNAPRPPRPRLMLTARSLSHGLAMLFSIVALFFLIRVAIHFRHSWHHWVGLSVYGLSLVVLYTLSTTYHVVRITYSLPYHPPAYHYLRLAWCTRATRR